MNLTDSHLLEKAVTTKHSLAMFIFNLSSKRSRRSMKMEL